MPPPFCYRGSLRRAWLGGQFLAGTEASIYTAVHSVESTFLRPRWLATKQPATQHCKVLCELGAAGQGTPQSPYHTMLHFLPGFHGNSSFKPAPSEMHLTDPISFNNRAWQHLIALQRQRTAATALPHYSLFRDGAESNMHILVTSCLGTQVPLCPSSPPHFILFSIFSLCLVLIFALFHWVTPFWLVPCSVCWRCRILFCMLLATAPATVTASAKKGRNVCDRTPLDRDTF